MSNFTAEYINLSLLDPKWWSIMVIQSASVSHGAISSSDIYAETHIKLILDEGVNLEI